MLFSFWTVIGIVAALLTSLSYLPQVQKMWRRKSVEDVSHTTIYQMSLGCILWLVYGIGRNDFVIIGANVLAIGILSTALVFYYHYRIKSE
jgi:MtN3 and saliva related transmembrane protein